ncbi:MAG TPA: protein kinase [Kofleriaceae bacterium]
MNEALEYTATAPGKGQPPATDSAELAVGTRLGHFRVEKKLGAGGMGEVYLATDLALDRPVAVKVLPAGTGSKTAHDRMVREARAQARVQHPNVAHIYFIGEEEGRLYFAMEHVAGQTLAEALANGPLAADTALAAIRAAVLGLREAHRSGFTHRDVKPSNLMYDAHGVVKVLDFGLAASTPGELGDGPVAQTSLAGTPLYMAPEQAHGDPIDLRSDIYALGATLYHLVAGDPPFHGETLADLVTQHETAARPSVPKKGKSRTVVTALDQLVARMMAPAPKDRFASYDDLLAAIDLIATEQTRSAGFGVRTAATLVDVMFAAIFVVGISAAFGLEESGNPMAFAFVIAITTLLIWRNGSTVGKSLFELEVVTWPEQQRPSLPRAFARQMTLWFPLLLVTWLDSMNGGLTVNDRRVMGILVPLIIVVWMFHLAYAVARSAGKRAFWDRVSGTHVRYRANRRTQASPIATA